MSSWLTVDQVLLFLSRFNLTVRELRSRGPGRSSFHLADETDLRDLAYAALKPLVHDLVRLPLEGGAPDPGAGAALRSRALELTVEVKSTLRPGAEQTLVKECGETVVRHLGSDGDSGRHLVFFLYDPDDLLPDHAAVVRDLGGTRARAGDELVVHVAGPGFPHLTGPSAGLDSARSGFSSVAASDQESMLRLGELLSKRPGVRGGEPISFSETDLHLHLRPGTTRRLVRATLGERFVVKYEAEDSIVFEELPPPTRARRTEFD